MLTKSGIETAVFQMPYWSGLGNLLRALTCKHNSKTTVYEIRFSSSRRCVACKCSDEYIQKKLQHPFGENYTEQYVHLGNTS